MTFLDWKFGAHTIWIYSNDWLLCKVLVVHGPPKLFPVSDFIIMTRIDFEHKLFHWEWFSIHISHYWAVSKKTDTKWNSSTFCGAVPLFVEQFHEKWDRSCRRV